MSRKKVLYVMHNHPAVRPGGAEAYALELYHAMRESPEYEPLLVARIGPKADERGWVHPGAPFSRVNDDPNQYFIYTEAEAFDWFLGTYRDKSLYLRYFADFLRTHRPDVVHFQHSHFIGYEVLALTRRILPGAPILYTLQEYLPICHRDGQMVRTVDDRLCTHSSPRRCHECFPEWSPQHFFLRERFIKAHLDYVDLFLAPSNFLRERFIEWGIAPDRIRFEDYGRLPRPTAPEQPERPRTKLAFFGQVSPYKGLDLLLRAMGIVQRRAPEAHLWVYGANIDILTKPQQEEVRGLMDEHSANTTFIGAYDHAALPGLMASVDWVVVPSKWWENSPLVIQEAFMHGRPVICADVGGMAEKVTDGVNGMHFVSGNIGSLADTIFRAVRTPGQWERLQQGIQPIFAMDDHVANLTGLYQDLAARRAAAEPELPPVVTVPGSV